ncbi:hypothetical protein Taro_039383 [Colocasia esculenta]|uniref:Uncharacterized protein n=1 Tax=Colocasia esculenta TaxID=4460 RepID=A0A843W6A6_COLES|nr:hypothetical protein [Colocasia esculenta]
MLFGRESGSILVKGTCLFSGWTNGVGTSHRSSRHGHRPLGFHTPEPIFGRHRIREDLTGTHVAHDVQESSSGISRGIFEAVEETHSQEAEMSLETEGQERMDLQDFDGESSTSEQNRTLRCPLCRGAILGYRIDGEVRQYLDQKPRSCSRESCTFSGNYTDLRRHARRSHPTTRPADVNPSKRQAWRRLEREQEIGDVISAVQSTSPGAIVIGDYAIDSGDGLLNDHENNVPRNGSRSWSNTLLLLQMFHEPRNLARPLRTRRRPGNRNMWDVDALAPEDDENNNQLLDSNEVPAPQRRRRITRSRTFDDSRMNAYKPSNKFQMKKNKKVTSSDHLSTAKKSHVDR